jgi:hypothetical protein
MQRFVVVSGVAKTCYVTLRHYQTTLTGHKNWLIVSGGWEGGALSIDGRSGVAGTK